MFNKDNLPAYIIYDPVGNITALFTEPVSADKRAEAAAFVMSLHPTVEQVGFLGPSKECDIALEMAGGEFCGNATMCAAGYYSGRIKEVQTEVTVEASGADKPVNVFVEKSNELLSCTISMPMPLNAEYVTFSDGTSYPVVRYGGADHIINMIKDTENIDREHYEKQIKAYCNELGSLCTGIMFVDPEKEILVPLVYVPEAETLFWENSCAGGTAACGYWLAKEKGAKLKTVFNEPGGGMVVEADDRSILLYVGIRPGGIHYKTV